MYAGIVLAAGASTRLGRPKALLEIEGEAAVARVVRILRVGGCDRVIVVLGSDSALIEPAVPSGAEVVIHTNWQLGQTSSLLAGMELTIRADAILVAPVDRPLFDSTDVQRLLQADADLAVPVHEGRRGHPLRLAGAAVTAAAALTPDQPLHVLLNGRWGPVLEVEGSGAGVLANLDTQADYAAIGGGQ